MNKLRPVIILVVIIWAVFLVELTFQVDLSVYGIVPLNITGLRGIIFAPFLHGNIYHLTSNTIPLAILGSVLFLFYYKRAYHVLIGSILLTGMAVWIFGRPNIHIGISGVIYAFATFLVFAGFYRRKFWDVVISIAVIIVYGGLIWGLFPGKFYISYESHIAGALSGILLARMYYKKG